MESLLHNQNPLRRRRPRTARRLGVLFLLLAVGALGGWLLSNDRLQPRLGGPPEVEASAVEPIVEVEAAPELVLPERLRFRHSIGRDQTLGSILWAYGVSGADVHALVEASRVLEDDERGIRALDIIRPGRELELEVDTDEGRVAAVRYVLSDGITLAAEREGNSWTAHEELAEWDIKVVTVSGVVDVTLWGAATDAGLSARNVRDLARIWEWDVDFNTELRRGDAFRLIIEEKHCDGEFVKYGDILGAWFRNQGEEYVAFRYQDGEENLGYYDENGESTAKAFLASPIEFAPISSHFNPNRRHPILHTIRAHNGTDYSAASGTPVRAVGAGQVARRGRAGGYGNLVEIRHSEQHSSRYAHLSRFAPGLRQGEQVAQGQVIGYVGSTGLATGPHLHFEFHAGGRPVDYARRDTAEQAPQQVDDPAKFAVVRDRLLPILRAIPLPEPAAEGGPLLAETPAADEPALR